MKPRQSLAWIGLLLAFSGCARSAVVSLVPALELRALVQREPAGSAVDAGERYTTTLFAWLRWQRHVAASTVPQRFEFEPATVLAPCEPEDEPCLLEVAEAEHELNHLLSDLP